jgi:hypothetical protein
MILAVDGLDVVAQITRPPRSRSGPDAAVGTSTAARVRMHSPISCGRSPARSCRWRRTVRRQLVERALIVPGSRFIQESRYAIARNFPRFTLCPVPIYA